MADELQYTDNGDGTATLNNDPAPTEVTVSRVPWEQMVTGEFAWAVVTQDEDNTQHLTITTPTGQASFTWAGTLPGRVTLLTVNTWT